MSASPTCTGALAGLGCLFFLMSCATPRPDSAVLVVVDTLRADHLGPYGGRRPTSPNLDRVARRALVFERAYANSPWTLPSVASVLTGKLPSQHGAGSKVQGPSGRTFSALAPEVATLAEELSDAGLHTAAFVNNPFLNARFGVGRGFATWDYVAGSRRRIRRADVVVDRAIGWLRGRRDQPFFLFVHLFDPHLNYDASPPYRDRFTGASTPDQRDVVYRDVRRALERGEEVDFQFLEAAYDEEIAFVDAHLGRLFAALEDLRLDRRTLVVVTADHGEEFGEHGSFEHGHSTFDEVLRVPLLVWGPGVRPGRSDRVVSLADVAPTVRAALGLESSPAVPGRSLLAPTGPSTCVMAQRPLYGPDEQALVRWPWKLIVQAGAPPRLYDLGRDVEERVDVAAREPDVVRRLRDDLARCGSEAAVTPQPAGELDAETEERLRSLGYLDD